MRYSLSGQALIGFRHKPDYRPKPCACFVIPEGNLRLPLLFVIPEGNLHLSFYSSQPQQPPTQSVSARLSPTRLSSSHSPTGRFACVTCRACCRIMPNTV
jgi:hypothetical protein